VTVSFFFFFFLFGLLSEMFGCLSPFAFTLGCRIRKGDQLNM
jgi:hypothetical protein